MTARTILQSEFYNALYEDGVRVQEGKPGYLDAETLARLFPDAALYWVPEDVYDDALDGAGYPERLNDFPISRCQKLR